MLSDLTVDAFLQELAGPSAAPGGGTAAALAGASGAALVSMVCNLTLGRKKYADVAGKMQVVLQEAQELQQTLLELMEKDARAYDAVMAAYRLPRDTAEQKAARTAAIQEGLKGATRVPMETLRACVRVLELAAEAVAHGNVNVVSDGGAGVQTAYAGLMTAAINVRINLNAITDEAFIAEQTAEMEDLLAAGTAARDRAWQTVLQKLGA